MPQTPAAHAKKLSSGQFIPGKTLSDVAVVLHERWHPCKGNLEEVRAVIDRLSGLGRFVFGHDKDGVEGYHVVDASPQWRPRNKR